MKKILIVSLLLSFTHLHASHFDARAKEHLDVRLSTVGENSKRERLWQGTSSLAVGALMVAGAVFTPSNQVASDVPLAIGVGGGLFALSGMMAIAFPTDFEAIPQHYAQIPESTSEEIILKVGRGENYLAMLSTKARRNRLYSSAISLGLGMTEIIWYASAPTANRNYLLYQGLLFAVRGIIPLLFESEAEAQFRAYREWKGGQRVSLRWNLVPLPSGAGVFASLQF